MYSINAQKVSVNRFERGVLEKTLIEEQKGYVIMVVRMAKKHAGPLLRDTTEEVECRGYRRLLCCSSNIWVACLGMECLDKKLTKKQRVAPDSSSGRHRLLTNIVGTDRKC